jgi:hypothetical protein
MCIRPFGGALDREMYAQALYLAVTNGGSTLEGYYKTKFGLLTWEVL